MQVCEQMVLKIEIFWQVYLYKDRKKIIWLHFIFYQIVKIVNGNLDLVDS